MKKILIMSDTHGDRKLYKKIIEIERPIISIHAGDFCIDYDEIKKDFNYIVAGNNDFEGPDILDFEIDGIKFRLIHSHQFPSFGGNATKRNEFLKEYCLDSNIDVLITGHSHLEYFEYFDNNKAILNPGSLTMPRNKMLKSSYAILYIENGKIVNKDFEKTIKYLN